MLLALSIKICASQEQPVDAPFHCVGNQKEPGVVSISDWIGGKGDPWHREGNIFGSWIDLVMLVIAHGPQGASFFFHPLEKFAVYMDNPSLRQRLLAVYPHPSFLSSLLIRPLHY